MSKKTTTTEYIDEIAEFKRIAATIKGFEPRRILDADNKLISKVIKANGHNYIVLNERQSFTVDRFKTHLMLEQMFAHAKSLEHIVQDAKTSRDLANKVWRGDAYFTTLATHLEGIAKNYFEDNLYRDHISLYLCSLFIVREGSDLTNWDIDEVSEWIKDWVKEGLYAPDFFTLAIMFTPSYTKILIENMENGSSEGINSTVNTKLDNTK